MPLMLAQRRVILVGLFLRLTALVLKSVNV
ncbi:Uncharacterised protein [Klebsiella pneumoniae]|nr:Uncharacterised protein [Klebsiella pneumoniae]